MGNTNYDDLKVEDNGNVVSLLIVAGATAAGLLVGWFSHRFLGKKDLDAIRNDMKAIKQFVGMKNQETAPKAKTVAS